MDLSGLGDDALGVDFVGRDRIALGVVAEHDVDLMGARIRDCRNLRQIVGLRLVLVPGLGSRFAKSLPAFLHHLRSAFGDLGGIGLGLAGELIGEFRRRRFRRRRRRFRARLGRGRRVGGGGRRSAGHVRLQSLARRARLLLGQGMRRCFERLLGRLAGGRTLVPTFQNRLQQMGDHGGPPRFPPQLDQVGRVTVQIRVVSARDLDGVGVTLRRTFASATARLSCSSCRAASGASRCGGGMARHSCSSRAPDASTCCATVASITSSSVSLPISASTRSAVCSSSGPTFAGSNGAARCGGSGRCCPSSQPPSRRQSAN